MSPLAAPSPSQSTDREGRQHLIFRLGDEEYGVDILCVQELRSYTAVTPIPNAAAFIKGVMNLRGTIIPVVDLRRRFGMDGVEYDRFSVVIVVRIGTKVIGLLVDGVSDVRAIAASDIRPTPDFGVPIDTRLVAGVASVGDKLVLLLDLTHVITSDGPATGDDTH